MKLEQQGCKSINCPSSSKDTQRKKFMELPDDCWISIFNSLGGHHRHFEFISLVSRRFLSITNHLRRGLTITDKVIPFLPNLLCRFPNIGEINFYGDLDELLHEISASNIVLKSISLPKHKRFPVEGLRHLGSKMQSSLRVLNCSTMWYPKADDDVSVMNMFPFLEELDISYAPRFSDASVLRLSLLLKKLCKINLSGNESLTDQSILYLSSNCLFLRELRIHGCRRISAKGVGIALRDFHHLNTIAAGFSLNDEYFEYFSKSLAYAENLDDLDLWFKDDFFSSSSIAPDEFLEDLANANLPLKKLNIHRVFRTYEGISNLLNKCRSLVYLDVRSVDCLTDQNVAEISKSLRNLTHINLSCCRKLTSSVFFAIIRNCPFLCDIKMCSINQPLLNLGIEESDFAVNYKVKYLELSGNSELNDEFMKRIAFTCPNLQKLGLGHCWGITVEGINEVLRNCHEIKHLDISWCKSIKEFNIDIQLPNLEVLRAARTSFDDKSLEIIGERCNGLLHLNLEACANVSGNGVTKVVNKCRKLRQVNLSESEKKCFLPLTCRLDYYCRG